MLLTLLYGGRTMETNILIKAKHKALDVAIWFLARNQIEVNQNGSDFISNLKLQKLLYYAQGAFLGMFNAPIFNEELVAWKHGPVVPIVYHKFKRFGDQGIDYKSIVEEFKITENPLYWFSSQENELLEDVYDNFGQYSAWGLRRKTHNETPWKETSLKQIISKKLISEFFKANYIIEEA